MLDHINIVLVETTHAGNIGGVARAMKNMGLSHLRLVNPRTAIDDQATARAAGADDVLDNAQVYNSLAAAVSDCRRVYGTSARQRRADWPVFTPEQVAADTFKRFRQQEVAFVFGRESAGLNNQELDLCHGLIAINSNSDFSSLNLASSVQIISYVLRQQWPGPATIPRGDTQIHRSLPQLATSGQLEIFYDSLKKVMQDVNFVKKKSDEKLLRKLRILFSRRDLLEEEFNILVGLCKAVTEKVRK